MFNPMFNLWLYAVFNPRFYLMLYLCMPILSISPPKSERTYTVQMPELSVFFVSILCHNILYICGQKTDIKRTRYGRFCSSFTPFFSSPKACR